MIVSINQPAYLPWLGYFDRIAASDLHVVLDHVHFEKNSFTNRNKVRTVRGWSWLTVPVETGGKFGDLAINQLRIAADSRWTRKHWSTIEQSYAHAPHFAEYRAAFAAIYTRPWEYLIDLTDAVTGVLLEAFNIGVPLRCSSDLDPKAKKSDLVLEICRKVGADVYLSGSLGRNYLDEPSFAAAGVKIAYHNYRHPTYLQAHPGFEPYMAAIDLLFMQGAAGGQTLRTSAHRPTAVGELS